MHDLGLKIIDCLKSGLTPEHFWDASSAIANSGMVLATLLLLWTTVKLEKDRNRREFIEVVVTPVLARLNGVESFLRGSLPNFPAFGLGRATVDNVWNWKGIKANAGYIIYRSNRKIVEEIDIYDQQLQRFENLLKQQIEVFAELIRKDFKENVLPKIPALIAVEYRQDNFLHVFPYDAQCRITIGGKYIIVSMLQGILFNMTLSQYLKEFENDPTIPNTEVTSQDYMIGGARKGEIGGEVLNGISVRMKEIVLADKKLNDFILEYKGIINKTESLRKILKRV